MSEQVKPQLVWLPDGFGAGEHVHVYRATDYAALHAEAEALRGLTPELPPRPPEGAGLPRYGLRWNGPAQPLSVPMDDGYWTPWHLAEALRAENGRLRDTLLEVTTRHFAESWKRRASDKELEQYLSAGIAQLEGERDQLRAELAAEIQKRWDGNEQSSREHREEIDQLRTELATLKAQEVRRPVNGPYASVADAMAERYPAQEVRQDHGDITLTPDAAKILAECIGAHAYVLQALVNGRSDLALMEAKKWVDGFKEAAEHDRQAPQGE